MRTFVAAALLVWAGTAGAAVASAPKHPYRGEYKKKTFGRQALAPVLAGAGIREARNSPRQWGRGPDGFAKRLALLSVPTLLRTRFSTR